MIDAQNYHLGGILEDSVEDAVGPSTCGPDTGKFTAQRFADPTGVR